MFTRTSCQAIAELAVLLLVLTLEAVPSMAEGRPPLDKERAEQLQQQPREEIRRLMATSEFEGETFSSSSNAEVKIKKINVDPTSRWQRRGAAKLKPVNTKPKEDVAAKLLRRLAGRRTRTGRRAYHDFNHEMEQYLHSHNPHTHHPHHHHPHDHHPHVPFLQSTFRTR